MSIYTKRNAAVGYLALRLLNRRRPRRSGLKLGLYIALGLVSFGILAGVLRAAAKRRGAAVVEGAGDEPDDVSDETEAEIIGEYVTTAPEPIPAT